MRFQKRFVVLMIVVVLVAFYKFQSGSEMLEEVDKFRGANIKEDVFSPMIAQSVNSKRLIVSLNNHRYSNEQKDVYMSEQLNIMVTKKALMEGLRCSAHLYNKKTLLILQGDTEIEMVVDAKVMRVNGKDVKIESPVTLSKGRVYVPLQPLQRYLNFSLEWNMEKNKATAITTLETSYLPSSFDLRNYERVGDVSDQGNFGTCWAFASLTALESSMLPEEEMDFSADHMSMRNSFSSDQTRGGEYTMGMAYLTSWQGPVLEKDDPYGDHKSPDGLKAVKHVQEIQLMEEKDIDEIKEAVYKYGAVQTSLFFQPKNPNLYMKSWSSYYYKGQNGVNHDIAIIGWDDSFKADNFAMRPEGDGAFICQNSWGTDFGEEGIFYVSYYDSNIGSHSIFYTGIEDADNYDNIYQSDLCGWGGQLGYNNKDDVYAANVFEANDNEVLSAVGFYAIGEDTSYEVYVVPQFDGVESLKEGWKVASGTKSKAGYYTVKLNSRMKVTKGEKFAVVLKIKTPGTDRPLAVEYQKDGSSIVIDLTDGESYISPNGKRWESAEENQKCNVCIKAYTNDLK